MTICAQRRAFCQPDASGAQRPGRGSAGPRAEQIKDAGRQRPEAYSLSVEGRRRGYPWPPAVGGTPRCDGYRLG